MAEAVVIVAPGGGRQQDVERGDRLAPGELVGFLQPFRMLHDHRSRHHRERLVGRKEPVPPGEGVSLQPAFAVVFAEHFHHPAIGAEVVVDVEMRTDPATIFHLEHIAQPVGCELIRGEDAEVLLHPR